ncbi:hypothetical protein [Nocardia sp. NPDC049707]|uniref:hypothetical protein n=1 Tax=Nocardia sp. NPDC049707 TaxID=3154735 RepID=UPI00342A5877
MFSESSSHSWQTLAAETKINFDMIPAFRAWIIDTAMHQYRRWYTKDDLFDSWTSFAMAKDFSPGEVDHFYSLTDLHTVTPEEASEWGVQAPFLRCGEFLALWPFAFHVLHPDLGFLSLLVRRHSRAWDRTVGSTLAFAADWFGSQIRSDRISWVARRRHRGIGEADLVLLDRESGDVVVLELKTTYDKFRTNIQSRNFIHQRVNFPKAISQCQTVAAAIDDGSWPLRELFGKEAPARPTSVTGCVLTWWDIYNPTLGSEDSVVSCNYDSFLYVLEAADGDLVATVRSIRELSTIYCPGVLIPRAIQIDEIAINIAQETQGDQLPPRDNWGQISPLTASILEPLPKWESNWQELSSEGAPPLFIYSDEG